MKLEAKSRLLASAKRIVKTKTGLLVPDFKPPLSGDTQLEHRGQVFSFTGKSGTDLKTKSKSYEYEAEDSSKLWVSQSGTVTLD